MSNLVKIPTTIEIKSGLRDMNFRQACVCVILGPIFFGMFVLGAAGMFPLLVIIGWLLGEKRIFLTSWEICWEPPVDMFLHAFRGID